MDIENVTWTVSPEAKRLVQSGQAVFSSGGVRSLDGSFKELAIPIVKSSSNEVSAPPVLSALNSSTNKVTELIKGESRITNCKLDRFLNLSSKICLNTALSWANVAINLANCGLSFVFYRKQNKLINSQFEASAQKTDELLELTRQQTELMTLFFKEQDQKLCEAIGILNEISNKIEQIDNKNRAERIRYFLHQADSDITELLNGNYDLKTHNRTITSFLNEIASSLEALINDFEKEIITDDYYVQSIFLLGTLFTKETEYFLLQYLHKMGYEHKKKEYWYNIIHKIDNCTKLKKQIWSMVMLQSPEISPLEKRDYYTILNNTFSNHEYYMEVSSFVEHKLQANNTHKSLDEILNEKIINCEPLVI